MTTTPILIVGAGPAGLTLAIELARRGVEFRLIDAASEHFPGSRGKGLQPRTLEVFDDLGVLDEVLATGTPYPMLRAYQGGEVVMERRMMPDRPVTPDVPYPNTWLLPQTLTEAVLRRRLAELRGTEGLGGAEGLRGTEGLGGTVELDTELVTFTQDADGVIATVRRDGVEERIEATYLVGTDGGRSTVRRVAGVALLGETRDDQRLLTADVRVPGLDRDHWHFWGGGLADSVGLCPLAGTDLFVLQAGLLGDERVTADADGVRALFHARSDADLEIGDPVWASIWRANIRLAQRFRTGRVLLAGDAAHVHSPTGGQGLNTSIQDAYNLAWKLAATLAGAPEAVLDSYEQERLPVAERVLGISTRLLDRGVAGDTEVLRRDDPELAQLHISYQQSPLSVDERAEPGALRAGDRAPDAPCATADGSPVRLFDLYRRPTATVLAFGAGVAGVAADHTVTDDPTVPGALLDTAGHVRAAYDVADGTVVVVRPDGHVGLVGSDPTRLAGYLADIGATPVSGLGVAAH